MISTRRLDLVPATIPTLEAALSAPAQLGALLGATVPKSWPPPLLDEDALRWTLEKQRSGAHQARWSMYWIVLRENGRRVLIGTSGFKGNPTEDGTVEIGYGIVDEYHRQGYATETTRALVERAFQSPTVLRVIAETLPSLEASIGVLVKCGFRFIGDGSERGVVRYEITRA